MCLSGGFTPGYGDIVFQTGGASVLSVHAFHILVMEVLPSRQLCVVRVSGGFTPVMEVPSSRWVAICTAMTGAHALEIGL